MAVYEVVLQGKQGVDDMLNVFHYEVPDGLTPDWQAGADEWRAHIANYLQILSNPNVVYSGITVRLDSPGQVGVFYAFTSGDVTGTAAADDALREAAILVHKRNTSGTRPALGWFFQGGISVNATQGNGAWEGSATSDVELYADDIRILGAVATGGAQMVIKARNPTAPNTVPYAAVDAVRAVSTPRTVRSRRGSVGS